MALNALFTGSTALQTFSSALDVVGNNLANLNTTGFKGQRTVFKDLVYQTLVPGSAPSGGLGGTNPTQSGFGVAVGSVDTLTLQGGITPTGRDLDAAIDGNGFFVLAGGSSTVFTRAGSFAVDAAGFLVDPNTGFRVQRTGTIGEGAGGFQVTGNNDIRVPFGAGAAGVPTANVQLRGNLSANLTAGQTVTSAIQVFNSLSNPRVLNLTFTKTGPNAFALSADIGGVAQAVSGGGAFTFSTAGTLATPASGTLTVTVAGVPAEGTVDTTVAINLGTVGQTGGLTQFGGVSTAAAVTQDGFSSGTLTDVAFDQAGRVSGRFSNGRTVPIAQLAIAAFNNEAGLIRTGSNFFSTSAASGEALIGVAGDGGRGTVQGSALEGSNVDISAEFARLIIAQRGFQVNARTISAANDTLQELASILR
ncbi:MAG: flagellar hook protein FlgE [Isosphaera sp.]|nr:flagellar hook protein FlgE [Isosphaera sp.]